MIAKKRLQVFISSTYRDMKDERQAAVEAILSSGHIPAGMELFAAGDESQMEVIRRWIDESDVFLLILGGCYGSMEPKSGKSYIHLEYEHALDRGMPLFAVVAEEEHLRARAEQPGGLDKIETEHPQELKKFRKLVLKKMVRFWQDPRDIKLAIHEAMTGFARRPELEGWVQGKCVRIDRISRIEDNRSLEEEIRSLKEGNSSLEEEIIFLKKELEEENSFLRSDMWDLEKENLNLEEAISLLRSENLNLEERISFLCSDMWDLEKESRGLEKKSRDLEKKSRDLEETLYALRQRQKRRW